MSSIAVTTRGREKNTTGGSERSRRLRLDLTERRRQQRADRKPRTQRKTRCEQEAEVAARSGHRASREAGPAAHGRVTLRRSAESEREIGIGRPPPGLLRSRLPRRSRAATAPETNLGTPSLDRIGGAQDLATATPATTVIAARTSRCGAAAVGTEHRSQASRTVWPRCWGKAQRAEVVTAALGRHLLAVVFGRTLRPCHQRRPRPRPRCRDRGQAPPQRGPRLRLLRQRRQRRPRRRRRRRWRRCRRRRRRQRRRPRCPLECAGHLRAASRPPRGERCLRQRGWSRHKAASA